MGDYAETYLESMKAYAAALKKYEKELENIDATYSQATTPSDRSKAIQQVNELTAKIQKVVEAADQASTAFNPSEAFNMGTKAETNINTSVGGETYSLSLIDSL